MWLSICWIVALCLVDACWYLEIGPISALSSRSNEYEWMIKWHGIPIFCLIVMQMYPCYITVNNFYNL